VVQVVHQRAERVDDRGPQRVHRRAIDVAGITSCEVAAGLGSAALQSPVGKHEELVTYMYVPRPRSAGACLGLTTETCGVRVARTGCARDGGVWAARTRRGRAGAPEAGRCRENAMTPAVCACGRVRGKGTRGVADPSCAAGGYIHGARGGLDVGWHVFDYQRNSHRTRVGQFLLEQLRLVNYGEPQPYEATSISLLSWAYHGNRCSKSSERRCLCGQDHVGRASVLSCAAGGYMYGTWAGPDVGGSLIKTRASLKIA
jgi:hypothetical protein